MIRRSALRRGAVLLLVLVCAAIRAPVALAHPEIISTDPPNGAQLDTAPAQAQVRFNEPVEAAFSSLQVFNAQGQAVDNGDGARSPSDPTVVAVTLPPLDPGVYTAVWQVVGSDGHTVTGNFVFTVSGTAPQQQTGPAAAPEATPAPTPAPPQASPPPVRSSEPPLALVALTRALMLLGALASVGGWVLMRVVLRPSLPAQAASAAAVERRWRTVSAVGLGTLLAATAGFLLLHTYAVAGQVGLDQIRTVLAQTRLGQALAARMLLALALLALPAIRALARWEFALAMLLGGGLLLTFAVSGHAAALELSAAARGLPVSPVLADWAHLAATSLWVGGLIHLALLLPPALRPLDERGRVETLARVISRFSALALGSVVVLAASGTYTALQHLSRVDQLWTSAYGQALLVKLALFGALLLIGGYNMFLVRPRFNAWATRAAEAATAARWSRRFHRAVRGEVVLALVVLGAAGVITSVAPPGAQEAANAAAPQPGAIAQAVPEATPRPTRTPVPIVPFDEEQPASDLLVGLEVQPAGIGKNTLQVSVRNAEGEPLDVQRVQLTLNMTTMDMGETTVIAEPEGPGRYVVPDQWLSMVGDWRVRVVVRRIDADDVEAIFVVPVGG